MLIGKSTKPCALFLPVMIKSLCFLFKLNVSYPATGCQKLIEVDDERKVRIFYDKRMSSEVAVDSLGDEWKVCVLTV